MQKKAIVRGCNLILGLVLITWFVMLGTDYYKSVKKFDEPLFARESVKASNEITIYKGIGYEIEIKKSDSIESLSFIEFRLFHKSIAKIEIK